MKNIYLIIIIISNIYVIEAKTNKELLPIRNILKHNKNVIGDDFYVGGTIGYKTLKKREGAILNREFSYVTPENDFKIGNINPSYGKWNFKVADKWIKSCLKNGQVLRVHGPISPQCTRWDKKDKRTPEELSRRLVEYMTGLSKYLEKNSQVVKWMDVVNEIINGENWFMPSKGYRKWENPWPKIGFDKTHSLCPPLYIKMAFEISNKYAPSIKQIINQHGQNLQKTNWDKIKKLVYYLREKGLRVDGIGWQSHVNVGWEKDPEELKALSQLIDWAHANNLEFHVTEANVWMKNNNKDFHAQAKTFAAIFKILLEKRNTGVVAWNTWHLSDADQWSKNKKLKGCIFDFKYQPKPAYFAIKDLLLNPPKPNN